MKRTGFTLAETIITLGIVSIVAALTIPQLINKFKNKQYETAFKRTNSEIQQALNLTAQEYGLGYFTELIPFILGTDYKQFGNTDEEQEIINKKTEQIIPELNEIFLKKLGVIHKEVITNEKYYMRNYSGERSGNAGKFKYKYLCNFTIKNSQIDDCNIYYLKGGSSTGGLTFRENQFILFFDTDGAAKGPNRLGYDIWIYEYPEWRDAEPWCTSENPDWMNGAGCYYYAIRNENANDKTKDYFKSLK